MARWRDFWKQPEFWLAVVVFVVWKEAPLLRRLPDLTLLAMAAVFLLLGLGLALGRPPLWRPRAADFCVLGLTAWMVLGLLWTPDKAGAGLKLARFAGLDLSLYVAIRLGLGRPEQARRFLGWCLAVGFGLVAWYWMATLAGRRLLIQETPFSNHYYYSWGVLASLTAQLLLHRLLAGDLPRAWRILGWPAYFLATGCVVLAMSRGALIGSVMGFGLALVLQFNRVRRHPAYLLGVLIFLAVAAAGLAASLTWEGLADKLTKSSSVFERMRKYELAWGLIQLKPLLGWGLGAFPGLGFGVYPHNLPLEIWCELGAPGLLLMGGIVGTAAARAWRLRRDPDAQTLAVVCAMLLVNFLFASSLDNTRWLWIFLPFLLNLKEATGASDR